MADPKANATPESEAFGFLYALLGSEPQVAANMIRKNPVLRADLHRWLYERKPQTESYEAMMARLCPAGLPCDSAEIADFLAAGEASI